MGGMDMSGVDRNGMPGQHDPMPGMATPPASAQGRNSAPVGTPPWGRKGAIPPMSMTPEPSTDLAITGVWGRTRSLRDNSKENSYLLEALLRFARRNYVWTRMEDAGRSNELLLAPGSALPAGFAESPIGHVGAYTFGFDRDVALGPHVLGAPGVQFTAYRPPQALRAAYGATPTAEQIFLRFRLR